MVKTLKNQFSSTGKIAFDVLTNFLKNHTLLHTVSVDRRVNEILFLIKSDNFKHKFIYLQRFMNFRVSDFLKNE